MGRFKELKNEVYGSNQGLITEDGENVWVDERLRKLKIPVPLDSEQKISSVTRSLQDQLNHDFPQH